MWEKRIREFGHYLKLERSLSDNSVGGYVADIEKLRQFIVITHKDLLPENVTAKHLSEFLGYITELGMSAHSQARILSGLKSFYKYLVFEGSIEKKIRRRLLKAPRLEENFPIR